VAAEEGSNENGLNLELGHQMMGTPLLAEGQDWFEELGAQYCEVLR
jgi:hypothetical protein